MQFASQANVIILVRMGESEEIVTVPEEVVLDPREVQAEKGRKAVRYVLDKKSVVQCAMSRPEIGDICFSFGNSKEGFRHLVERREREIIDDKRLEGQKAEEVALKIPEIIAFGEMTREGPKWIFRHEGFRAIVVMPYGGDANSNPVFLTGYRETGRKKG